MPSVEKNLEFQFHDKKICSDSKCVSKQLVKYYLCNITYVEKQNSVNICITNTFTKMF